MSQQEVTVSNKLRLNIDEDVFTDVYWKVCDITSRFLLVYGSTGSSKSFTIAQKEILKGLEKKEKILVIRKVGSTLKDSVYASFKNRLNEFSLQNYYRYTSNPLNIFLANGTEILFRGLDDPEKLKSIEGITRIVIEEATELEYDDFKELNRRVRGVENIQITLVFNPIDEDHWINQHFFINKVHNATIVHSTHWDNPFLSQEDHDEIESIKQYDENQYNIYALGIWGKIKTGSEFFPQFSTIRHVGVVPYLPHLSIHQSWDFNWLPYLPMCLFQVAERVKRRERKVMVNGTPTIQRFKVPTEGCKEVYVTQVRAFKEYAFRPPQNDVDNVSAAYIEDFGKIQRDLFIYGDASGKSNVPGHGDGANFKRIKKNLAPYLNAASDRVLSSNPSVMKSRDFMNKIFSNWYPIEFILDEENCPTLKKDLESVLLSKDGMLKVYEKDKKTGVSYQKWGHFSDILRYMMVRVFSDLFKSNV